MSEHTFHDRFNRLIAIALTDRPFAQALLHDPVATLDRGYQGQRFDFSPLERQWLVSAQGASSLNEFVNRVSQYFSQDDPLS